MDFINEFRLSEVDLVEVSIHEDPALVDQVPHSAIAGEASLFNCL